MTDRCLLTNGLKGKDADGVITKIKNSQALLDMLKTAIDKEISKDFNMNFDKPSWAYEQAFEIGYKKGLQRFLEYVKIYPDRGKQ